MEEELKNLHVWVKKKLVLELKSIAARQDKTVRVAVDEAIRLWIKQYEKK